METNQNDPPVKQNYYTSKKRKVVDFLIGFIAALAIGFLIPYLLFIFMWNFGLALQSMKFFGDLELLTISGPLGIILFILFMIRRKRKFIIIGAICGAIIPFLISGWCLVDPFNK